VCSSIMSPIAIFSHGRRLRSKPPFQGQCIMKERPASECGSWKSRRLRYAVQGFAPLWRLESDGSGGCGRQEEAEGPGKSAGEWHVTLEGKISVGTNNLSRRVGRWRGPGFE